MRHILARGTFATALGAALVVGGMVPLAPPATADTAGSQEIVVPTAYKPNTRNAWVHRAQQSAYGDSDSVGSEGVFHRETDAKSTLWTRFSDGKSFPVAEPEDWVLPRGTGTDALAYVHPGRIEWRHSEGTVRTVHVPEKLTGPKVYGSTAVAFDTAAKTAHLLSPRADGTTGDVEIEEPAGFDYTTAVAGDALSVVLPGPVADGRLRHAVVSAETGRIQGLTPAVPATYTRVKLSPEYIAMYSTDRTNSTVLVASRRDLTAPAVPVTVKSYALPLDHIGLVGDWLTYNGSNNVEAVPVNGGSDPVELLADSYSTGTGPDGTAVAVGGTGPADWAVRRITAGADGKPAVTTVKKLPGYPGRIERIALAHGRLAVVDDSGTESFGAGRPVHAWMRDLDPDGAPGYGARTQLATGLDSCPEDDTVCSEYRSLGDGRFMYRMGSYVVAAGASGSGFSAPYFGDRARVRDINDSYVIVDVPGPTTRQVVVALADSKELESRTPVASALWSSWLWTAGAEKGTVAAKDLVTGKAVESVDTGAPCVPEELQAVGRWLYWSCGANGPAGVYDRTAKSSQAVPAGDALLGDGYVVTHDKAAGTLVLTGTDRAAHPVSRTVGTLPDTGRPQRHLRWTVDRFGGHVAYVDAQEQVHVVPAGVVNQPLSVLSRLDSPVVHGFGDTGPVTSITLSKRADWVMTLRQVTTGKTVELSGDTSAGLRPRWTGRDADDRLLANGQYTWTLTARPADGVGAEVRLTGSTILRNGASLASDSFTSVPTKRVMDTRAGIGVAKGKIGPQGTVTLDVAARAGISPSVSAVALHVTATDPTSATFVSAYPTHTTRTGASNLNLPAGKTVSNLVIVPVTGGKATFYNHAGTVDLIADIAGYYDGLDATGALYRPMTPWRALDTRSGLGAPKAKVNGGSRVHVPLGSTAGGRDVTAVVLNVTATNVTRPTVVTAVETGLPVVGSHLNPEAGETRSNLVVVPVRDGGIDLYNHAGSVDLIADVAGYYTGSHLGSLYEPLAPSRAMDTRDGTGVAKAKVGPGRTVTLTVAGRNGVPATGATAVVLNVTATGPTAGTFVSVHPYGTARTSASNLNVPAGKTVSNLVIVPVKDGKVSLYNHAGSIDLIADVQGFYAP